jgi:type II secretory pathway pseudopilin PulG
MPLLQQHQQSQQRSRQQQQQQQLAAAAAAAAAAASGQAQAALVIAAAQLPPPLAFGQHTLPMQQQAPLFANPAAHPGLGLPQPGLMEDPSGMANLLFPQQQPQQHPDLMAMMQRPYS